MTRPTAAVVGSAVAGLTAAHLLQRRYDVTFLEADDRLGSHAHTHEPSTRDGGATAVDSGFIVHEFDGSGTVHDAVSGRLVEIFGAPAQS